MNIGELFTRKIRISVIGAYVEEYLTELIKSGVKLSQVNNKNGVVYFFINRIEYKKVARLGRLYNLQVKINKKNKLKYDKIINKKHTGLIIGIIIISFVLIISQKFVWRINIYGNDELSENLIKKTIAEHGIFLGAYSDRINSNNVENAVKLDLKEISWINIDINGSRIDVYLNEGKSVTKPEISMQTPCNVIASHDGVIIETEVYSGTLMYNKGSGISKGSILVSGVVNDGANNLILTHANAKIIAEFTETVKFRKEFTSIERKTKDNKEIEKELMIMGFVIPITERVSNTENKTCKEYTEKINIVGLTLPFIIKTNEYSEYEEIEVTRTIQDVNKILEQEINDYCKNFFYDFDVLDINKNISYDDKGITVVAQIKLKGDIAVKQEIMRKNNLYYME